MKSEYVIHTRSIIFLLLTLIFVGSIALFFLRETFDREKNEKCYRNQRTFSLRVAQDIPDNAIVFVGDSLVRGLCVAAVAPYAVNLGIGRDTTMGVLQRIGQYNTLQRARAVVLLVGINDLIQGKQNGIIARYSSILRKLPRNVDIISNALLPVDERMTDKVRNRDILSINKALQVSCSRYANCHFFDCTEKFIDFSGNLEAQYHIGDGIHLNRLGYGIWIENLKTILEFLDVYSAKEQNQ